MGVKTDPPAGSWTGNLHKFHLKAGSAYCHECHNNVHSNVEATNTIYGNGAGGELPDDAEDGIVDGVVSTHLINFAPRLVTGSFGDKPKWFLDTASFPGPVMSVLSSCHDIDMNSCFYAAPVNSGSQCWKVADGLALYINIDGILISAGKKTPAETVVVSHDEMVLIPAGEVYRWLRSRQRW